MGIRTEAVDCVTVSLVNVSPLRSHKRNYSELRCKTQQNTHLKREFAKHSDVIQILPLQRRKLRQSNCLGQGCLCGTEGK